MNGLDFIFSIAVLIMSVVVHEVSHGYAAYSMGDMTAKYEGRLTLNPIKHLDPLGSFVVPVLSYLAGGFIIGWAKPVPYNRYNLRNQRWGELFVAAAGVISNIFIAILFGLIFRFGLGTGLPESFLNISAMIVFINILLAVFNLVPIPPLDGSKIIFALLPESVNQLRLLLERYSLVFILVFVFILWRYVAPLVVYLATLVMGVPV